MYVYIYYICYVELPLKTLTFIQNITALEYYTDKPIW